MERSSTLTTGYSLLSFMRICKDKVIEFDNVEHQQRTYSFLAGSRGVVVVVVGVGGGGGGGRWGGVDVIIHSSFREVLAG